VLESGNIKLGQVASDVLGLSGRLMLRALAAGEQDAEKLAELAQGRLKSKKGELRQALAGQLTVVQRWVLSELLERWEELDRALARVEARIREEVQACADPFVPEAVELLDSIPGVGEHVAHAIVAEIGVEMDRFPSDGHLASWAGMSPGNNESAGKRRSGQTTKGSTYLRTALIEAAWAASHGKGTYWAAKYKRLVKRLVAEELTLSFVPEPDLRLLRTVTRRRYQLSRARVMFQNQLESLLEQAHIKLSSLVSDLLGSSARRMLKALSEGVNDPAVVAAMADRRLRATAEQLRDALGSCTDMNPHYRRLIKMALAELQLVETHIQELDQEAMELLHEHQEVVRRIAAVPGFGVDSAMQMIAEVGVAAANFATAKNLVSWVGVCPGDQESAGKSQSTRSPKGNRHMRRLLTQAAHAAVKVKGSIFELTFNRHMRQMKYKPAIWAIAHRLCRLLWLLLSKRVDYEERGPEVSAKSKRVRTSRMIRELKKLGYRIEGGPAELTLQY